MRVSRSRDRCDTVTCATGTRVNVLVLLGDRANEPGFPGTGQRLGVVQACVNPFLGRKMLPVPTSNCRFHKRMPLPTVFRFRALNRFQEARSEPERAPRTAAETSCSGTPERAATSATDSNSGITRSPPEGRMATLTRTGP